MSRGAFIFSVCITPQVFSCSYVVCDATISFMISVFILDWPLARMVKLGAYVIASMYVGVDLCVR